MILRGQKLTQDLPLLLDQGDLEGDLVWWLISGLAVQEVLAIPQKDVHSLSCNMQDVSGTSDAPGLHQHVSRFPVARRHANALPTKTTSHQRFAKPHGTATSRT